MFEDPTYLILLAIVAIGLIIDTVFRKRENCPDCDLELPKYLFPKYIDNWLLGTRNCPNCGTLLNGNVSAAPRFSKRFAYFGVAGAYLMGPAAIYLSFLMLSDIPAYDELIWIQSSRVSEVKYREEGEKPARLRFYVEGEYCLSVSGNKDGFSALLHAIDENQAYAIGYNKERQLFSDDGKLYNIVYEIHANGETVKSYRRHIILLASFFGGVGVFGVLTCWFALKGPGLIRKLGSITDAKT